MGPRDRAAPDLATKRRADQGGLGDRANGVAPTLVAGDRLASATSPSGQPAEGAGGPPPPSAACVCACGSGRSLDGITATAPRGLVA